MSEVACPTCGNHFAASAEQRRRREGGGSVYCSKRCYTEAQTLDTSMVCCVCEAPFRARTAMFRRGRGTCSVKCRGALLAMAHQRRREQGALLSQRRATSIKCAECGRPVEGPGRQRIGYKDRGADRYCSTECGRKGHVRKNTVGGPTSGDCLQCGTHFDFPQHTRLRIVHGQTTSGFCSQRCAALGGAERAAQMSTVHGWYTKDRVTERSLIAENRRLIGTILREIAE